MLAVADLPHLAAYLANARRPVRRTSPFAIDVLRSGLALLLVVGTVTVVRITGTGSDATLVVLFALFLAANRLVTLRQKAPDASADPLRDDALRTVEELRWLQDRRELHTRLHPAIGRALEDCATSRHQLLALLDSPEARATLRRPLWRDFAPGAREAAEQSMEDAVLIARPRVRARGQRAATFAAMIERDPLALPEAEQIAKLSEGIRELAEGFAAVLGEADLPSLPGKAERVRLQIQEITRAREELEQSLRA